MSHTTRGSLGRLTRGPFWAVWLQRPLAAPWADTKNKQVVVSRCLKAPGIQVTAMSSQRRTLEGADNRELLHAASQILCPRVRGGAPSKESAPRACCRAPAWWSCALAQLALLLRWAQLRGRRSWLVGEKVALNFAWGSLNRARQGIRAPFFRGKTFKT